jgi:HEAT repeat protein
MIQRSSAAGKGTRAAGVAIVVLAGLGRPAATLGASAASPPATALESVAPQDEARLLAEVRAAERARALEARPIPRGRIGRLITELRKGSAEQRVRAADQLRDPAAIPWLIQSLGDGELVTLPSEDFPRITTPAGAAAQALGAIGLPALEPLATVLADGAVFEQHQAIIALVRIGGTRVVELLGQVLVDPERDLSVRVLAARSLAQFRTPAVADRLASVLDTRGLGLEAAQALAEMDDRRGARVLTQALQAGDTVDPYARSHAALALSKTPDAAGLDLLLTRARAACTAGHFLPAHMECGSVAKALATLRDPRAVPVLIDALEAVGLNDLCAWDLSVALHAVGARARQALIEVLATGSAPRRRAAIEALRAAAQMGDGQGAEALLARITADPDPELRRQALYALHMFGARACVEGARQALDDPETRLPALQVLGDSRYKKEARQVRVLDAALRQLDDADPRVVAAAAAVFRSVSGEDKGTEPGPWRAWWAATRPVWLREEAFGSRVLRLEGRLVDASGQPVPGKRVAVCHRDGMEIGARGNGASSCGQDPFGTLAFLFDGDDLVNPRAETSADGRFSIVDSGRFLSAGERFSLFWFDGARCHRLTVRQEPWIAITIDDDVIDLGALSLTEKPGTPPASR